MRTLLLSVLIPAAIAGPLSSSLAQARAEDRRPGIAVFPPANGGSYGDKKEELALLSIGLQQTLMYELAANAGLRVVDRSELRRLLEEQNLGPSGRVDPATAARIGKIVGARYAVIGGFVDWFGQLRLDGHVVDVQTSEVVRSAEVTGDRKKLFALVTDMAGKITTGINLPPLPAAIQEERKSRPIPPEAMGRHASILAYRDEGGDPARAIQLYRELIKDFPMVEEYKAELKQLTGGR